MGGKTLPSPQPPQLGWPSTRAITTPAVGRMFYSHFLLILRGPGSDRRLVPVSLGPGSFTFGGLRHSMAALQTPDQGPSCQSAWLTLLPGTLLGGR